MNRILSLIGVVLVMGCAGPEPQDMETLQEPEPRDMGTLRGVDGLYLNPEDGQPYSGPVFGENNGKRMTGYLRDGKWDGPFESYHENGQLRRRGTYKDGVEDGPVEEYYDNGQLYEKGAYKDGEPCGEWFEGRTVTYDPC